MTVTKVPNRSRSRSPTEILASQRGWKQASSVPRSASNEKMRKKRQNNKARQQAQAQERAHRKECWADWLERSSEDIKNLMTAFPISDPVLGAKFYERGLTNLQFVDLTEGDLVNEYGVTKELTIVHVTAMVDHLRGLREDYFRDAKPMKSEEYRSSRGRFSSDESLGVEQCTTAETNLTNQRTIVADSTHGTTAPFDAPQHVAKKFVSNIVKDVVSSLEQDIHEAVGQQRDLERNASEATVLPDELENRLTFIQREQSNKSNASSNRSSNTGTQQVSNRSTGRAIGTEQYLGLGKLKNGLRGMLSSGAPSLEPSMVSSNKSTRTRPLAPANTLTNRIAAQAGITSNPVVTGYGAPLTATVPISNGPANTIRRSRTRNMQKSPREEPVQPQRSGRKMDRGRIASLAEPRRRSPKFDPNANSNQNVASITPSHVNARMKPVRIQKKEKIEQPNFEEEQLIAEQRRQVEHTRQQAHSAQLVQQERMQKDAHARFEQLANQKLVHKEYSEYTDAEIVLEESESPPVRGVEMDAIPFVPPLQNIPPRQFDQQVQESSNEQPDQTAPPQEPAQQQGPGYLRPTRSRQGSSVTPRANRKSAPNQFAPPPRTARTARPPPQSNSSTSRLLAPTTCSAARVRSRSASFDRRQAQNMPGAGLRSPRSNSLTNLPSARFNIEERYANHAAVSRGLRLQLSPRRERQNTASSFQSPRSARQHRSAGDLCRAQSPRSTFGTTPRYAEDPKMNVPGPGAYNVAKSTFRKSHTSGSLRSGRSTLGGTAPRFGTRMSTAMDPTPHVQDDAFETPAPGDYDYERCLSRVSRGARSPRAAPAPPRRQLTNPPPPQRVWRQGSWATVSRW